MPLRVLNLVTNEEAQFFRAQVEELERRGVELTTLSVPGRNRSESIDAEEDGERSILEYARFYPSVLANSLDSYDLIHANYGLTAPMAVAQPRLPVVLSLWGTDLMGKYGPVTKRFAHFCDEVIVMSEGMAEEYDGDCLVIPHGVDLSVFRPIEQSEAREALGWPRDERVVLFPYPPKRDVKNHPRAKRIVERASDRVGESVTLETATGVPHDRMPYYLNAADAMIMTSRREGSPNTVKEAMACNLPVVSTDVGDVRTRLDPVDPSTVSDDDHDLVAGLTEILERGERSTGREYAADIALERMGERIVAVYEKVIED
ncbi:glycosyltransferase family 4 protein [Halomicroarcula sp. F27]|uniref:Glycosyltransferase family 4 protein n=1 Tax=Haloarcula nitratireducens TaxID=2487749 RepID=A0AAW4P831_9EURY|nr:glycosyltransferase family 4 protein [Halomicroarcula nitratireducens]MBX0294059.1 glycosyltransferase family 4 protein [Halomicroarcula nitratireducens]